MSFYRKYRPQTLKELVGQEHVKQTFLGALKKDLISHAYLFTGPRGTGKTSTARIIARAVMCADPAADGEPCNQCEICRDALAGRLVDLIEIDAASNRGIDEMRDLKEKITFSPNRTKAKVYIIDEVHMLTKEAFNALLKTLEEPPDHAYFILATTEIHKVPETIISRCQRFDFHQIGVSETATHLKIIAEKENIKFVEEALTLIARQSAGGLRDALGMLEQIGASGEVTLESVADQLGLTRPKAVDDFVHAILFGQAGEALDTITELVAEGVNLIQFNKALLLKLRELMLEKIAENKIPEAKRVVEIIEIFTQAGEGLKDAIIPQLPLEIAAIEVCGVRDATSQSEVKKPETKKKVQIEPVAKSKSVGLEKVEPERAQTDTTPTSALLRDELRSSQTDTVEALAATISGIKKSSIKLALKECVVLRADEDKVVIGAPSDFYLEKLDNPSVKSEVAEILSMKLQKKVTVEFERAELELASAAPAAPIPKEPAKKVDLVKVAENLFSEDESF